MVASSRGPVFLPPSCKIHPGPLGFFSLLQLQMVCKDLSCHPGHLDCKGFTDVQINSGGLGSFFWAGEPSLLCLPHSVNLQSRGGHRCKVVCQSLRGQVVEEGQELGGRKGQISKPDSTKVINRRLALVSGCYDDRQGHAPQRYGSGTKQPLPWNCPGRFIFALCWGAAGARVPQHLAVHLCLDALLVSVLLGQFRELGVNGLI
uniref:Uncharacterized protein n=1 Tax=Micrurus corallinus TaxID=54390 RepID=A0A2D4GNV4_MICCO